MGNENVLRLLFIVLFISIISISCSSNENSKIVPESLELISIDSLFQSKSELTEDQVKTLKGCLEIIKNRSYVEEKKRFEMERQLIESIRIIKDFGPDASFTIPILVYLLARDDYASDQVRDVILGMGEEAIPYLENSLKVNNYTITIKTDGLLYELDMKERRKYLRKLIAYTVSINKKVRLIALKTLNRIPGIEKQMIPVYIDMLKDDDEDVVTVVRNVLSKQAVEIKTILRESLTNSEPAQSARVVSVLWAVSDSEERADLEQVLLRNLKIADKRGKKILMKVMVEINISHIPGEADNFSQILKDKNFLNSDWRIFVRSTSGQRTLISLLENENIYVRLHSLFILAQRGEYLDVFNLVLKEGLEDSNKMVVEETLDIVNRIILGHTSGQVTVGNQIDRNVLTGESIKERYEFLINPLIRLLGREEALASKSSLLLKLWEEKSAKVLSGISFSSKNKIQRVRACGMLIYFESVTDKNPYLKILRNALKNSDPKIRETATDMLILSIVPPECNIPAIIEALALEERNSIRAAASLYFADKTAIPYLQEAIFHKNRRIAVKAMGILARNSGDTDKYVPVLAKAFEKGDINIKKAAVKALEDLKEEAVSAASSIIPGLGSKDFDLSWRCKSALKYMGKGITESLIKYGITSTNRKTVLISHSLLVRFDVNREENLKPLINALNTGLIRTALREMAELKDLAIPAIKKLIENFENKTGETRNIALYAIFRIDPDGKETMSLLMDSLKDNNHRLRETACFCLGSLGPKAEKAIPELKRLAGSDKTGDVRALARGALRKIKKGY